VARASLPTLRDLLGWPEHLVRPRGVDVRPAVLQVIGWAYMGHVCLSYRLGFIWGPGGIWLALSIALMSILGSLR